MQIIHKKRFCIMKRFLKPLIAWSRPLKIRARNNLSTLAFKDELEFLKETPHSIVLYLSFKHPTRLLLHANGSLKTLLSVSFDFNQSFNLLKQDEKAL